VPLAALAVLALRHCEPAYFATRLASAKLFAAVLLFLFLIGWVGWLASSSKNGQSTALIWTLVFDPRLRTRGRRLEKRMG
jgi:hypothetical protein